VPRPPSTLAPEIERPLVEGARFTDAVEPIGGDALPVEFRRKPDPYVRGSLAEQWRAARARETE
jgi:hypothetical protein